jgi:hypothetical protein
LEELILPSNVKNVNYKQILGDLKLIGESHKQINSVGFGDITQITMDIETKKEPEYIKMYILPGLTTLNRNQITYNFNITVMNRVNDDYSNQRDVMNDTLEIIKDIFTKLYLSQYQSEWGAVVSPFLEEYETILGGWTLSISLTQPYSYDRCEVPIKTFVNKTWSELSELWNTISKNWKDV